MKISEIQGSLKHGQFVSVEFTPVCFLGMGASILIVILSSIFIPMESGFDTDTLSILLAGNILDLAIFTFCLVVVLHGYKLKKKIRLWLEDAVELKAYAKKQDDYTEFIKPSAKISVHFKINGKKYSRVSEGKSGSLPKGYHGIWTKYADKEIDILYSPKYDQVLVLKKSKLNKL
jgi:hypothetical protein